MFDVALASGGAQVILSTSSDDEHPPENMIDGLDNTFWVTTGLFPQEVCIRFQAMMSIKRVELSCYNVQSVSLQSSENENDDCFESLAERELEATDHQLQNEDINVGEKRAQCLRLLINSGHDHFVAVYKLKVDGSAVHG